MRLPGSHSCHSRNANGEKVTPPGSTTLLLHAQPFVLCVRDDDGALFRHMLEIHPLMDLGGGHHGCTQDTASILDEGAHSSQVFAICSTHSWTPVQKQSHAVCSRSTWGVLRGPWISLSSLSFASQCSSLQGNSTWLEWYTLTCSSKNSLNLVFTASNTLPLQVVACKQVLPHFPVNWLEVINYAIKSFLVHNFTLYLKALGNTRSASQTFFPTMSHKSCILSHSEGLICTFSSTSWKSVTEPVCHINPS